MIFGTTLSIGGAQITGSIVFAVICALIAASKGRSAFAWGLGGFFLQCFALLFVLCVGDMGDDGERESINRQNRRRMNERMKRESAKLDTLRSEMRGRLDAHDLAAGIDTRGIKRPLQRQNQSLPPEHPKWFYEEGGNTAGPITAKALIALRQAGVVPSHVLVWKEGLSDWTPLNQIDELTA